jgi:hypothetical protein
MLDYEAAGLHGIVRRIESDAVYSLSSFRSAQENEA